MIRSTHGALLLLTACSPAYAEWYGGGQVELAFTTDGQGVGLNGTTHLDGADYPWDGPIAIVPRTGDIWDIRLPRWRSQDIDWDPVHYTEWQFGMDSGSAFAVLYGRPKNQPENGCRYYGSGSFEPREISLEGDLQTLIVWMQADDTECQDRHLPPDTQLHMTWAFDPAAGQAMRRESELSDWRRGNL